MTTDHSEFINRHRRQPVRHKPGNRGRISAAIVISIFSLYFVLMLFVVHMARVDQTTIVISMTVFVMATLVAFVAKRAQFLQAEQEKELILLKEMLEGSHGALLITDTEDKTLYNNERFDNICPPEEEEDGDRYKKMIAMFSENNEVSSLFRRLIEQVHRGLSDSIELYCSRRDYEGWYHISAQPIDGHPGLVHWRVENVTNRYTADRSIREEREKLIDFTDNAPVGFFSVDETGHFVFANATFARWLGVDLKHLLEQASLHTYLVNPPEEGKPYDLTDVGGERQVVEVEMKGAAGKTFLASVNYGVMHNDDGSIRTRAVLHDLTSEQEMRRALKASEDKFERFYEEAPLGIVLLNDAGVIEDCNRQFANMINRQMKEIEGISLRKLLVGEHRDGVLSSLRQMQKGQPMSEAMDVSLQGEGDKIVSTQLHARRFTEGGSTVLHFIDVTEKKSLEQQFVQSQKMQAVGQLAGGIAHDFNNLLTAIIGFCDLLLLRHKAGDPSFGDIMQIKQNSNRAANLVRQLLAFSRQQTLRQRIHDMTDILTELSHLLRRLIGAQIDLDIIHGSDLGLVKVDEGQMEQVLINLAVNARDAMDGSGKLTITTENFSNKKTKSVTQEEMPPGDWVLIKVADTGSGISKKNMGRILEPFFTTKGVGEGTGLGLATVYGIIRQSGGFLDIQSKVGKGTTFCIYLPRASEADEEEEEQVIEKAVAKDLTGTERILLVEDEAAVRTFSQRALVNKGYEVLCAENGEMALDLYEKAETGPIDLLITDVVMPGVDGPTLAQRVRQNSPELKIIFMSGYTEDKLKDYMGDNTYFLPKPFTLKVLAEKVKEVLEE